MLGVYRDHPAIKKIRSSNFPTFRRELWASQFVNICHNLPVRLPGGGTKKVSITRYKSGTGGGAYKRAGTLRRLLRDNAEVKKDHAAIDWLDVSKERVRTVYCGHGILEEISLLCELAVKADLVKPANLQKWIDDDQGIGLDCNGFTNAYYTAIGCFLEKPIHYHNKYRSIAGVAFTWDDINYDSTVLWAHNRLKTYSRDINRDGKVDKNDKRNIWEVIPNMTKSAEGVNAHIGVVDHVHDDSVFICQHGSNQGPRVSEYKIVSEAEGRKRYKAAWKLQERGKSKQISVIITKPMPTYAAGE